MMHLIHRWLGWSHVFPINGDLAQCRQCSVCGKVQIRKIETGRPVCQPARPHWTAQ